MSDWYWRVIALKATFILTCLVSYLSCDDTLQKLPFCNPNTASNPSTANDLVIVSTLDGRLTAFSTNGGKKAWDLQTQPLLSSNLHQIELTSGGKWVRLVPSLRGTLYTLSGDTVEALPFDADQLLSSSFKFSNDLVIAGARETVWVGLDAGSGRVIYQCGSKGCTNNQETANGGRELLVLRQNSNSVRALDPRSGNEKWNFSVSEHQLTLSESAGCMNQTPGEKEEADLSISIAMPDGVIGLHRADSPNHILWEQKLEAPVAGMWRLRSGSLKAIDVLWAATKSLSNEQFVQAAPPSLYIGLHNQQLYIQEGQLYVARKMETAVAPHPAPWKVKASRPLITGPSTALKPISDVETGLALITLYRKTMVGGSEGFFLYEETICDNGPNDSEYYDNEPHILGPDEDQHEHHHVHVHIYSLWYWWKEVLLIAISSALLMNLMIWPRFFAPRLQPASPLPINQEYIVVERHYDRPPSNSSGVSYSGRYECDFTPLRCLGRGGFGVVFEARNNIDHCSYAVKRITLPRRESKRDRVLREVRALAKLEHEHIVRYFNAWLEEPPPNWQEQRDAVWMRELDGVSVALSDDFTSPKSPPSISADLIKAVPENSVLLNLQACDNCEDLLNVRNWAGGHPSRRNRSLSCNDSFSIVFDENASSGDMKSKESLKRSLNISSEPSFPKDITLSKNLGGGDDDDSFIVFANSEDLNHNTQGLSGSFNKKLEKVKDSHVVKSESTNGTAKKKGHRRHWSLDICVRSTTDEPARGRGASMYLYIQMQLCLRDSLHDWLRQNRSYEARQDKANSLFSQIVAAVEYVHLAGLIHRDLKPSNIFFAPDGRIKVGDFGLVTAMADSQDSEEGSGECTNVQTRHTYRVGTHLYMSPEQLRGAPYSYKVDIYSLGLILFELLQPFGTETERVGCLMRLREGSAPNTFTDKYPEEMKVLQLMLCPDPAVRPTASGVRARAPLLQATDERWHFTLPPQAS